MSETAPWLEYFEPHRAKIGPTFEVKRALPFQGGKGVGPFVFLDQMGPHEMIAGESMDVRPHPHIGLSTLTYLFEGEIEHRDSLGTIQRIKPGDVNWMTAGSGIVHSERSPKDQIPLQRRLHGMQAWVALPLSEEDRAPSFEHHKKESFPAVEKEGVSIRVIIGEAFGKKAPPTTFLRIFYAHALMKAGSFLSFDPDGQETALYLIEGSVEVDGKSFSSPGLLICHEYKHIEIRSREGASMMLLGGDRLPEKRTIWWNFVSSSKEKLEAAKARWRAQSFDRVPGETEFIPLPE